MYDESLRVTYHIVTVRLLFATVVRYVSPKFVCSLLECRDARFQHMFANCYRFEKRVSKIRLLIATVYRNASPK